MPSQRNRVGKLLNNRQIELQVGKSGLGGDLQKRAYLRLTDEIEIRMSAYKCHGEEEQREKEQSSQVLQLQSGD